LQENMTLVNPFVKEKSITIRIDCQSGLQGYVDYEMINLIVRNLVSNAVKFTPKGKSILLKAFRNDSKIILEVSNEGDPIPEAVREKLFTFQVRSGQGTANESGTGLGLAMSQQFAVLNGGKIFLDERTGSVNTFRVELPVVQ
jgi:signal transduction histidine kinase